MSSPLLSICIPTYNRAAQLSAAVQSLLLQIRTDGLASDVEICISDNASSDETPQLLEILRAELGVRLVAVRLPDHKGYAYNCQNVVKAATGEYVALCGDDDPFLPGAVRTLLEASRLCAPVVLLNSHPSDDSITLPTTIDITDPASCVSRLGVFHASFIGNLVVRREQFLHHFSSELLDSAYPHYAVVMRALAERPGVFLNRATVRVDDRLRTWRAYQAVYTAIDMARLQTEEVLNRGASALLVRAVYWELCRSIPRALLALRSKQITSRTGNPYGDLGFRNVLRCYRRAIDFQVVVACLWLGGRLAPMSALRALLAWRNKVRTEVSRRRRAMPVQTTLML